MGPLADKIRDTHKASALIYHFEVYPRYDSYQCNSVTL